MLTCSVLYNLYKESFIFIITLFVLDLELSKLDDKLIQILAWQRLQQLMPSKNSTDSQRKNSGSINGLLTTPGMWILLLLVGVPQVAEC